MAKLLTVSEVLALPDRSEVWMEWLYGTEARKYVLTREAKPSFCRWFYDVALDDYFLGKVANKEYRYWDSEPTLDEREGTSWSFAQS